MHHSPGFGFEIQSEQSDFMENVVNKIQKFQAASNLPNYNNSISVLDSPPNTSNLPGPYAANIPMRPQGPFRANQPFTPNVTIRPPQPQASCQYPYPVTVGNAMFQTQSPINIQNQTQNQDILQTQTRSAFSSQPQTGCESDFEKLQPQSDAYTQKRTLGCGCKVIATIETSKPRNKDGDVAVSGSLAGKKNNILFMMDQNTFIIIMVVQLLLYFSILIVSCKRK